MALQPVGVMAVVEGLQDFLGDIDKINGALERLRPSTNLLENAFNSVSDAVSGFGEHVLRVVETALGVMLRDAIEWVIGKLGELAAAAIDAGNSFQLTQMRLEGFNLQDAIDSGMEYTEAMQKAVEITKEQMTWIMRLAATTPFDATDIANAFSMLKSWKFTVDESKELTKNILDFTAAMGLSGVEVNRIVVNFGQMAQAGKITTREMNDLARGAFVPVREILGIVAEKLGKTTAEMIKLVQKPGGGVDYKLFVDAFNELVTTQAKYAGGSERMAHTLKGAWENIYQTVRDVIGGFILLPGILDPIGDALGKIMDVVGERWIEIESTATRVGMALKPIIERLLGGVLPRGDTIVDLIVNGLDKLADWLENPFNTIKIYEFFYKIQGYVADVRNWIVYTLIPAFNTIRDWVKDNGSTIEKFFGALSEIISGAFSSLFGGESKIANKSGNPLEDVLSKIKEFMQWVIDHQDALERWAGILLRAYVNFLLIQAIIGILMTALINFFQLITSSQFWFNILATNLSLTLTDVQVAKQAVEDGEWGTIGELIIKKIVEGVIRAAIGLVTAVINAVRNALAAAQNELGGTLGGSGTGGRSNPGGGGTESATGTTSGGSIGSKTGGSWTKSSGQSSISTSSKNVATTNNFNLTVNTAATKENITSDFRTLAALNNYAT